MRPKNKELSELDLETGSLCCNTLRWYYCTTRFTMLRQFFLWYISFNNSFNVLLGIERSRLIPYGLCPCYLRSSLFFFTFLRYSSKAFLAGDYGCSHSICPNHVTFLISISLLHGLHFVLVCSSLLLVFLYHLILIIFLKCLHWKVSVMFSWFFFKVYNSLLYRKILAI